MTAQDRDARRTVTFGLCPDIASSASAALRGLVLAVGLHLRGEKVFHPKCWM
jgi:hypothetical protein